MHLKPLRFRCYLVRNPHCPAVLSDKTEGIVIHWLDDTVWDSFHGQRPHQCCKLPDSYFMGTGGKSAKAWTHLHLVPRSRMTAATPLLPLYALWRAHEQLYLTPECLPVLIDRTREFAAIATVLQYLMLCTLVCYVRLQRSPCVPLEQLYWHSKQ